MNTNAESTERIAQAPRNTVICDGASTLVEVDGRTFYLAHHGEYWIVGNDDNRCRYRSARVAAGTFRGLIDDALLAQEARRRWERSFGQWITGVRLHDTGAPLEDCTTLGQQRGWMEQENYCRHAWRYQADAEASAYLVRLGVGAFEPATVAV